MNSDPVATTPKAERRPGREAFVRSSDQVALGSILAHHAQRTPGRAAVIFGDDKVTHTQLDARVNRRARLATNVDEDRAVVIAGTPIR